MSMQYPTLRKNPIAKWTSVDYERSCPLSPLATISWEPRSGGIKNKSKKRQCKQDHSVSYVELLRCANIGENRLCTS